MGSRLAGARVLFNHSGYFTTSASVRDWGLPRGGPRAYNGAYRGWRQNARAPGGYGNSYRRYRRRKTVAEFISARQRLRQSRTGAELRAAARALPRTRSPRGLLESRCAAAGIQLYASLAARAELTNAPRRKITHIIRRPTPIARKHIRIPGTQTVRRPSTIRATATAMRTGLHGAAELREATRLDTQRTAIRIRPIAHRRRIRAPIPAARMSPMAIQWRAMSPAVFADSAAKSNRSSARQNISAPKNYGGGGHFSAPKAPRMSHSAAAGAATFP